MKTAGGGIPIRRFLVDALKGPGPIIHHSEGQGVGEVSGEKVGVGHSFQPVFFRPAQEFLEP